MQQPTEKINQLTFTRFLAALSVVFFHSGRDFGFFQIPSIFASGVTAVSYFYVLSGFVMAYVYYRPLPSGFETQKYWLTRFSRIYPVYIFSFLTTCLYYIDIVPKTRLKEFLANLLLYQAWIPEYTTSYNIAAWSLSVEVFFYILVPVLIFFTLNKPIKQLIWFSLCFWIFSQFVHSILRIGYLDPTTRYFFGYFPLFHLNAFLLGFVGGVWYVKRPINQVVSPFVNLFLIFFSMAFVLSALYLRDVQHILGITFSLDVGLLAPFFLIIILALALNSTFLAKIFSHPWLVLLGDSSYALYILHVPFRWWAERILGYFAITLSPPIFLWIYLPTTIILCILIYKYLEIPARDWLRRNANKLPILLFDVVLIAIIIKCAFTLRLGLFDTGFLRTQRFAIFFGTVIFFALFMLFQIYKTYSWRVLGLSSLLGGILLTVFVYYAWQMGWVEGFPRPILAMIPFLVFSTIYLSHYFNKKLSIKEK